MEPIAIFKGLCHLSREIVSARKIDFFPLFYIRIWWSFISLGEGGYLTRPQAVIILIFILGEM